MSRKIKMFRDIVYVTFSCESEREQAVKLLDERSYKGTNLKVCDTSYTHLKMVLYISMTTYKIDLEGQKGPFNSN